jgi:hypothetical protein
MIDDGFRRPVPLQRAARMAWLAAGFLVRGFLKTGGARGLLQPIAGRRFAAGAAIKSKPALQLANPVDQCLIPRPESGVERLQLRNHRLIAGDLVRRHRVVHKRCHRHLDSHSPVTAQPVF